MAYPKRFYKKTKNGKTLRYPEKSLKYCRWCGTCFVIDRYKDFCSDWCFKYSEYIGEYITFEKRGKR